MARKKSFEEYREENLKEQEKIKRQIEDAAGIRKPEPACVFFHDLRRRAVAVAENSTRHAARKRLQAERAASGKKIEHASAVKISAEHGKYGLAHAVVRRSRSLSGRRFDPSAADAPRNDAHVCHLP